MKERARPKMKNYFIAGLAVIILVLSSLLYKQNKTSTPNRFPAWEEAAGSETEVPLLLYVFFSKRNCIDCMEVIRTLNDLPPHFVVRGIVPKSELENEKELRQITGAEFPLVPISDKYRRFVPWYTPMIIGVSPVKGEIIFSLPGVPGEKEYLVNFLDSLYSKLYPIFLKEKLPK
jgi:glutaredoxin